MIENKFFCERWMHGIKAETIGVSNGCKLIFE